MTGQDAQTLKDLMVKYSAKTIVSEIACYMVQAEPNKGRPNRDGKPINGLHLVEIGSLLLDSLRHVAFDKTNFD